VCHADITFPFRFRSAMSLPQTAAGIGAVGIDPSETELDKIQTFVDIIKWLGAPDGLKDALLKALGGGNPKLRDFVYISTQSWDEAIAGMRVKDGDETRALTPFDHGHVAMVRRIARLRLNLTAIDEHTLAQPNNLSMGRDVGSAVVVGDGQPVAAPTAEPRLKLSVILDPSLDSELVRVSQAKVRTMFTKYLKIRGAEPSEDIEPTVEQISAVNQVIEGDLVPYADFALFGPHGKRLLQKLTLVNWTYLPDGSWQRKELPGPHTFDHWWASFRVLRTTFLLLGTADTELLDNYGEMVRGFHNMYGSAAWFIIYNADVRMRSEHFERLRRHAERDHADAVDCGVSTAYDITRPWNTVFAKANGDKDWWNENLHRPTMLYLTRIKSASAAVDDGTSQPALDQFGSGSSVGGRGHSGPGTDNNSGGRAGRGRSRSQRRQRAGANRDKQKTTKRGNRICDAFNSHGGCHRQNCNDLHACNKCKNQGHSRVNCYSQPGSSGGSFKKPQWGPPKGGKGKYNPAKGKGGKGRGSW